MNTFKQAKDMFKLQQQAKKIKKELAKIHVEAEAGSSQSLGYGLKVVVNAEQEVISIEIADDLERSSIPELLKDALNRAMSKAQIVASEKMQSVMGQLGMNMPDMS